MGRKQTRTGENPLAPSQRQLRVAEEVRHALSAIFAREEFRDPDLHDLRVTVTEVRASPDLKHASAFVLPLGGGDAKEIVAALRRARGFLRSEVARRVELRHAPELHFELDRSFDEGARLEALLRSGAVKRDLG